MKTNLWDESCCYLGCGQIMGSIDELELTVRARNACKFGGITSIEMLRKMTERELLRIPNVGRTTVKELIMKSWAYPEEAIGWSLPGPYKLESRWLWKIWQ